VLAYAHHRLADGALAVDEVARSHTRDRTTRLRLRPDQTLERAEVSATYALGADRIEIAPAEGGGYRVRTVDIDGVETTTDYGDEPLTASDVLARTVVLALEHSTAAIGIDGDNLVETHLFDVSDDGSRVTVNHPREPVSIYEIDRADSGQVAGFTRSNSIAAVANSIAWERITATAGTEPV
jgi:hypothetical protein